MGYNPESPLSIARIQSAIVRIAGSGNYSYIHYQDGKVVLMAYSLVYFEEALPGFIRPHKQHLINPRYVQKVGRHAIDLAGSEPVPIARRRMNEIRQKLNA